MSWAVITAILLSVFGLLVTVAGVAFFATGDRNLGGAGVGVGLTLLGVSMVMRNTLTVNPEALPDSHPPGSDERR